MSAVIRCECGKHAFRNFKKHTITAIVDAEDEIFLHRTLHPEKYIRSNGVRIVGNKGGKTVKLHQMVMPNIKIIDHINRNPADNRKNNLRASTHRQNSLNGKDRKDWKHPTGVRGVYKQFRGNKFLFAVRVHRNGKAIHIGYFEDIESAKAARQRAAEAEYGIAM